jgi:hypothetical protein
MIYFLIKIKIIKEELFMYTDDSIFVHNDDLIDLTGKMQSWKDEKKEKYKILKIKEGNDFKNLYIYYLNRNDEDYNDFIKSLIKFENASPRIQKLKNLLEEKKMLEKKKKERRNYKLWHTSVLYTSRYYYQRRMEKRN